MANWDDEEVDDVVARKIKSVWDDELADGVPDSWDAIAEPQPAPIAPAPAPAKPSLSERIKQKEEQKRREKEERTKQLEEETNAEAQNITELQRQRLAEEAELGLLEDTFGGPESVTQSPGLVDGIDAFEPKTKEDFNKLNQMLRDKFSKIEKSPHFLAFVEQLLRDAIAEMDIDSVRTINTTITAMMSEKQKLLKGKSKKKGKSKLMVERDRDFGDGADDAALDADEYDDFM